MDAGQVSNKGGRIEYAWTLFATFLVRAQALVSSRRLRQGFPQVATFSFDYIGARINAFGRYERDELDALVAFLRARNLLNGACIDAGANIGNHAVFFSDHFSQVHAFEPSARPFALLQVNATLRQNIHCHNVGLSDHEHAAHLAAPQFNLGRGSVSLEIKDTDLQVTSLVRLVPLDSIEALHGLGIGLVKIDVEGHERAVLDGAAGLIGRTSPAIVFEQQGDEIKQGTSATIDRLRELGYASFHFLSRTPETRSTIINMLLRFVLGERVFFREASTFQPRYYSMIVALK